MVNQQCRWCKKEKSSAFVWWRATFTLRCCCTAAQFLAWNIPSAPASWLLMWGSTIRFLWRTSHYECRYLLPVNEKNFLRLVNESARTFTTSYISNQEIDMIVLVIHGVINIFKKARTISTGLNWTKSINSLTKVPKCYVLYDFAA